MVAYPEGGDLLRSNRGRLRGVSVGYEGDPLRPECSMGGVAGNVLCTLVAAHSVFCDFLVTPPLWSHFCAVASGCIGGGEAGHIRSGGVALGSRIMSVSSRIADKHART